MKFELLAIAIVLTFSVMQASAFAADSSTTPSLNVSLLNQNPDPARAGETVEIRFMVENTGGGEATNVVYELVPKFPFVAIPGEDYTRTIRKLTAYQEGDDAAIIKFEVLVDKNAVRGDSEIGLRRSWEGSDITATTYYNIEVTGTEHAQIIYVDKAKIYPGNETPLTFTITNVGNSPLRDLVFSWNEEDGVILPVYSDDTKYIKSLDVGESVDLVYTVVADVNADQGLYQIDLNLKYDTETGTTEELDTKAGIFVGGETDFDVTFSESSDGVTSLSVANVGNNPAYSVTVMVPDQSNYVVSGSTSTIVGNLDKGDYTIVSFQISQGLGMTAAEGLSQMTSEEMASYRQSMSEGSGTGNDLEVQIEYTDTTGIRHTVTKDVPIQFRDTTTTSTDTTTTRFGRQSTTTSSASYLTYALLLVLVVAGVISYRKREKLKPLLSKVLRRGKR